MKSLEPKIQKSHQEQAIETVNSLLDVNFKPTEAAKKKPHKFCKYLGNERMDLMLITSSHIPATVADMNATVYYDVNGKEHN